MDVNTPFLYNYLEERLCHTRDCFSQSAKGFGISPERRVSQIVPSGVLCNAFAFIGLGLRQYRS